MKWARRLIRRIRGRKIRQADVAIPLPSGMTQEDAITVAVTALRESLAYLGTDIAYGNVQHHTHCYDGMDVHHAIWTHDAAAAVPLDAR